MLSHSMWLFHPGVIPCQKSCTVVQVLRCWRIILARDVDSFTQGSLGIVGSISFLAKNPIEHRFEQMLPWHSCCWGVPHRATTVPLNVTTSLHIVIQVTHSGHDIHFHGLCRTWRIIGTIYSVFQMCIEYYWLMLSSTTMQWAFESQTCGTLCCEMQCKLLRILSLI